MGRQVDKGGKKSLGEAKEKHIEDNVKPLNGEKKGHAEEKSSVFTCGNVLMMIFAVIIATVVTAVIAKAVELHQLNDELEQTIGQMKLETEVQNQKFENSISESKKKTVSDGVLIKSLESEAEGLKKKLENTVLESKEKTVSDGKIVKSLESEKNILISKLNDLNLILTNNDQMLKEFKGTEDKLVEENRENKNKISSLNEEIIAKFDEFDIEKKELVEELKKTEEDKVRVEQTCDMIVKNINTEREAQTNEQNLLMLKKEAEISTISKKIESMQGQITTCSDENIDISKEVESLNIKNTQLFEEVVLKNKTINSLQEQNMKLSYDFSIITDETSQIIVNLEEEKKIFMKEAEINEKIYSEELNQKEEALENLISKIQDMINDQSNQKQDKIKILAKEKVEIESKCKATSDNIVKLESEKEEEGY